MPKVRGVNHITLAVKNISRSVEFYQNVLGLTLRKTFKAGAYLEAGDMWICLSLDKNARNDVHADYTHIAFDVSVEDFENMKIQLQNNAVIKWKENSSEGQSFYFLDPDGHKLEIHVGNLETRLVYMEARAA